MKTRQGALPCHSPGTMLTPAREAPAQREVTVRGVHFLQEDAPEEIGEAIATWLNDLPASGAGPR